jgi:hypothetical protein
LNYLQKKYDFFDINLLKIPYWDPHVKEKICNILDILSKYIPFIDKRYCNIIF